MEGQPDDITQSSAKKKCSALTGSARKIKDNAADWHNLLLRWEKLNDEGFKVAGRIVELRLMRSQHDELLLLDSTSAPAGSSSLQTVGPPELQDECCKLKDIVDKMASMVMKMQHLMASQQGVQDLEEFQFRAGGRRLPLFHSWDTKAFGDSSRALLESFTEELKLKQMIQEELAHTWSSDLCMVYLSCWLHQPFIPPDARLTLEALLLETGHRPL
ncbi:cyclin-dependent kinase 2-interacting protein [Takifugu flavidus]|uniref:Cyclin-dependent kinase 2-interacting protein n=1 Tax=Takifugu flavidus TaxID=433684 RepID=A0A5C6NZW7_9TELE|nr:cyclin-dependent kinase 2-interacting protein [Takifugu flavidus]TWW72368.1 Cyclin-dependent kinase 2-interacting protein [Takifugu flavidus]